MSPCNLQILMACWGSAQKTLKNYYAHLMTLCKDLWALMIRITKEYMSVMKPMQSLNIDGVLGVLPRKRL